MKIAIVGSLKFHLECIGFILEVYKDTENSVDIYLKKGIDKYNLIEYYLEIFNFNVIYDNFSKDIINNYDKIYKLTSNDYCLDDEKIISILHLDDEIRRKCKSQKFLSLTPYIQGDDVEYTFPIYSPILTHHNINKSVVMIGFYNNNSFDDDTIKFINNNNHYHFHFVVWGSPSYPKLKNIKNVTVMSNVNTNDMNTLIHHSKFILSKKFINYDRFSGQLALSMSYEKPLIIDTKTKNAYKLPGIAFQENYSELGDLDSITDENYESIKNEIKCLKNDMLNKNKAILNII
mgnify:CR=1 FL=1